MSAFRWSQRSEEAAALAAEDKLSDQAIADRIGVTERTLERWKQHPDFRSRVAKLVAEAREAVRQAVLTTGIADRVNRVCRLNADWERMQQVITERGADPDMENVPGGKTGLLVHQVKGVGKGDDFQLIDLYMVDAGLLAEIRAHEKQVAQELGQWTDRTEQRGTVTHIHEFSDLSDADLERRLAEAEGGEAPEGLPEAP